MKTSSRLLHTLNTTQFYSFLLTSPYIQFVHQLDSYFHLLPRFLPCSLTTSIFKKISSLPEISRYGIILPVHGIILPVLKKIRDHTRDPTRDPDRNSTCSNQDMGSHYLIRTGRIICYESLPIKLTSLKKMFTLQTSTSILEDLSNRQKHTCLYPNHQTKDPFSHLHLCPSPLISLYQTINLWNPSISTMPISIFYIQETLPDYHNPFPY